MPKSLAEQFADCQTLEELASAMEYRVREYGFAGFLYWTHLRVPADQISADNTFLVSRGPAYLKAFEALYLGKSMYLDDPVTQAAMERSEPFTTLEIRSLTSSNKTSRRQRWLYALEKRFGFIHDIYIPMHTPLRSQIFYAYCQNDTPDNPERIKELLPKLQYDVAVFLTCVIDFVVIGAQDQSVDVLFSVREQQCLTWMAKGRNNADIGIVLGITERTVKFHIKNIMKKLNADNRTHAIAIAARSGWITN